MRLRASGVLRARSEAIYLADTRTQAPRGRRSPAKSKRRQRLIMRQRPLESPQSVVYVALHLHTRKLQSRVYDRGAQLQGARFITPIATDFVAVIFPTARIPSRTLILVTLNYSVAQTTEADTRNISQRSLNAVSATADC